MCELFCLHHINCLNIEYASCNTQSFTDLWTVATTYLRYLYTLEWIGRPYASFSMLSVYTHVPPRLAVCSKAVAVNLLGWAVRWRSATSPPAPAPITHTRSGSTDMPARVRSEGMSGCFNIKKREAETVIDTGVCYLRRFLRESASELKTCARLCLSPSSCTRVTQPNFDPLLGAHRA